MTQKEWLLCADPREQMQFLRDERGASRAKTGRRRLRLFACACLRDVWPLLRQDESRNAVEVSEQYADGNAADNDLTMAEAQARAAFAKESGAAVTYWQAAEAATQVCAKRYARGNYRSVAHAASSAATAWAFDRTRADQSLKLREEIDRRLGVYADLLRDIFGNPFRPVSFSPSWRTDTSVALARQMYESREFSAMPILADALQDAGCDSEDVLNHCRDAKQVHVRGCWVVDLVLGKE